MTDLIDRIIRDSGVPEILQVLGEDLAPTDLQSLLLEVYARRAARQDPAHILAQYVRNRFVRPSPASPQALLEFDRLAFSVASPPFEAIDLSPVCPLGASSVIGTLSQNVTVSTSRNSELVSDSTNVLALECAVRRRSHRRSAAKLRERAKLCTSHRLLRAQHYDRPDVVPHFRAFALVTAGRDEGAYRFELETLLEQLGVYLELFARLREIGYCLKNPRVAITNWLEGLPLDRIREEVIEPLAVRYPDAQMGFDPERTKGRGYYERLSFHIYGTDPDGTEYEVADGGLVRWTQTLLDDRKERLVISGIGTERVCGVFGRLE
jgi:hypothetical protein